MDTVLEIFLGTQLTYAQALSDSRLGIQMISHEGIGGFETLRENDFQVENYRLTGFSPKSRP
jgi:hypothetical protein